MLVNISFGPDGFSPDKGLGAFEPKRASNGGGIFGGRGFPSRPALPPAPRCHATPACAVHADRRRAGGLAAWQSQPWREARAGWPRASASLHLGVRRDLGRKDEIFIEEFGRGRGDERARS